MPLSRIVLRLARNPGTAFAEGDDHRGYALVAPLTPAGLIDIDAWPAVRAECVARRFAPEADPALGRLARHGRGWAFDFDDEAEADAEPIYRLGEHPFEIGGYVTVTDHTGKPMTYKVTEVTAI
jgi:hypothetical protein